MFWVRIVTNGKECLFKILGLNKKKCTSYFNFLNIQVLRKISWRKVLIDTNIIIQSIGHYRQEYLKYLESSTHKD